MVEEKIKSLEAWKDTHEQKCTKREIRATVLEQSMCELKKDIIEIKHNQHEYMLEMAKFKEELFGRLEDKYVSKEQFEPVKAVVYGMVGFVLLAFLAGIVAIVFKA